MKEKHTIEDEVRILIRVAEDLPTGGYISCEIDSNYHGQEAKIIEGMMNVLGSGKNREFNISSEGEGHVFIEEKPISS